ncbi:MAG: MBL fold metallo-hydrolase [Candidatus Krumholzibacteria bacterium]|jgi:7,8-dihydropterin-6-yl-methyl-4-(beta-D-ribofuranosyl)aminobenzene 5'-phosphate synthase|nr:MBL fold metallo-hydrolase [Candidatus Krumholzibacteria bacterium]
MRSAVNIMVLALCLCGMAAPGAGAQGGIVIKVIYNNIVHDDNLKGRWGFACLVEGAEKTILFDTGGVGDLLLDNMKKMGIDPSAIDMVVLSHEHNDHTGGLEAFLKKNDKAIVFAPASFSEKFQSFAKDEKIKKVDVKGPMSICGNVYTTGEMGDKIIEQSLIITTDRGPVLITGCAHPGIVRIIEETLDLAAKQPLLVMGGFHLPDLKDDEVRKIAGSMRELGVVYCGPSHCTGDSAIGIFREAFGKYFVETGAGAVIEIDRLEWTPSVPDNR